MRSCLLVCLVSCWPEGARNRDDYRNIHFLFFISCKNPRDPKYTLQPEVLIKLLLVAEFQAGELFL